MDDPKPQFTHFITQLANLHPDMAYIHLIEPRISGNDDVIENAEESLDFAREAWKVTGKPFLAAGGYDRRRAIDLMRKEGMEDTLVVFGRWFVSNVRKGIFYSW